MNNRILRLRFISLYVSFCAIYSLTSICNLIGHIWEHLADLNRLLEAMGAVAMATKIGSRPKWLRGLIRHSRQAHYRQSLRKSWLSWVRPSFGTLGDVTESRQTACVLGSPTRRNLYHLVSPNGSAQRVACEHMFLLCNLVQVAEEFVLF